LDNQFHTQLKSSFYRINLWRILCFLIVFILLLIFTNDHLLNSTLYRLIYLYSDTLIGYGTVSYLIELIVFSILFFSIGRVRLDFKNVSSGILIPIVILTISVFTVSLIEDSLFDRTTLSKLTEENSLRTGFNRLWFILFIGFSEEVIFKFLFLTQILLRVGTDKLNRRLGILGLSFMFALMHIPELRNNNDLELATLLFPLLYSYLSSIIYIRYQNIPLLVAIHILLDIPIVFTEDSNFTYIIAGFVLMALLLTKKVFNSINENINLQKTGRLELVIAVLLPLMTFGVSMSKKSEIDYYNLSRESRRLEDFDKALEYADKSITDSEQDPQSFFNRGVANHSNGNYQLAMEDYNTAISLNPYYYVAIRNRGFLANDIEEYELCLQDLTIALENSLESAEVFLDLGTCNLELGNTDLAIEYFEKSRKLDKTNEKLYYELGRAYLKMVNFDSVVVNSKKAIAINNSFAEAYDIGAFGYSGLENYDSSNIFLNKTIELGAKSKIRDYLLGLNYYHLQKFDSSIKYLEKSLLANSTNSRIYYDLSNAYYELGNIDKTCENLSKAAELGHELAIEELKEFCQKGP